MLSTVDKACAARSAALHGACDRNHRGSPRRKTRPTRRGSLQETKEKANHQLSTTTASVGTLLRPTQPSSVRISNNWKRTEGEDSPAVQSKRGGLAGSMVRAVDSRGRPMPPSWPGTGRWSRRRQTRLVAEARRRPSLESWWSRSSSSRFFRSSTRSAQEAGGSPKSSKI